jgi:hypothetical protein
VSRGESLPILGVHGAPRSGTTWLGQIFNSSPHTAYRYQPFFAHAFRSRVDAAHTPQALEQILDDIAATEDDFILQRGEAVIARDELSFAKREITHMVYKEVRYHHLLPQLMAIDRFKGVGIVRNPMETLASWMNAPREFRPEWSIADEWRRAPSKNCGRVEEFFGYEGWKASALIAERMQAEAPHRFRILRYADLVRDPVSEVAALFEFAGLRLDDQTLEFVDRSTSSEDDDPYGVMRGSGGRNGADSLPGAIRDAILQDLSGTVLERYL